MHIIESFEVLLLSGFSDIQAIALWVYIHPAESAFWFGLLSELVAKYSPWKGADGLIETLWKAIQRAEPKEKGC